MKIRYGGLFVALAVVVFACAKQAVEAPFVPPAAPPGYKTNEELKAALMSGKIALITKPTSVPADVIEEKDIEYGRAGDRALKLDLCRPKDPAKHPVPGLILLHGGGWEQGDKGDCLFYAIHFAQLGYVTASVGYRFSQEAVFPAAVMDVKASIRWLRANAAKYGVDPERIGVLGGSAGGHLAMMAGYSSDVAALEGDEGNAGVSSRVQAVVDMYGPSQLDAPEAVNVGVVKKFIGRSFEEAPELYKQASPLTHVTADDPPTLVLHGTIDDLVPLAQSELLEAKLKEVGVSCMADHVEGWPHTMDMAADVNKRCLYFMDFFIRKYLGPAK